MNAQLKALRNARELLRDARNTFSDEAEWRLDEPAAADALQSIEIALATPMSSEDILEALSVLEAISDGLTNELADQIGSALAVVLHLRRPSDYPDRWITDWGTKTNLGLTRTVLCVISRTLEEFENKSKPTKIQCKPKIP